MHHRTGYLFQAYPREALLTDGTYEYLPELESWHRTYRGALRARDQAGRGSIYKILSEDQTQKIATPVRNGA